MTITGEGQDNPGAFVKQNFHISDRTPTAASVNWSDIPAWAAGARGSDQATPDLSSIVGEIINRPGWTSGNAIAFMLTGSGLRQAWTYDADPNESAELIVDYTTGPAPNQAPP